MKQVKPKKFVEETIKIDVTKEGWKSLKKQNPPEGVTVDVKFANGKIVEGTMVKNFLTFNPSKMDSETLMSKPLMWKLQQKNGK